jgi:hypothetical protein
MGNSKPRPATTWRSRSAGWATDIATGSAAGPGPRARWAKRLTLLVPALLASASALADPGYYLVTVYDNQGQANVDFRYWTVKNKGRGEVIWPEIGVGYGVTSRWHTGVLASTSGPAPPPPGPATCSGKTTSC